MTWNKFSYLVK